MPREDWKTDNEPLEPMDPWRHIRLLRDEIQFEHQLIANRLSVLVTVQPFLLAAFAIAATRETPHRQLLWFSYGLVPLVGLVVALLALLAVCVGERRLRLLRQSLYEDAQLGRPANAVCPPLDSRAQKRSLYYAVAIPGVFALAWIYIAGMGIMLLVQGGT
jgi:hypothetical protein